MDSERTLDVGCGHLARHKRVGDIGIDIHRGSCDIVADAHHLPFRNGVFTTVIGYHVLEHLETPLQAVKEMNRVCKGEVRLSIPSQYALNPHKTHIFSWNPLALKHLLDLVFDSVEVGYTKHQVLIFSNSKLARFFNIISAILSRLSIRAEIYATCKTRLEGKWLSARARKYE